MDTTEAVFYGGLERYADQSENANCPNCRVNVDISTLGDDGDEAIDFGMAQQRPQIPIEQANNNNIMALRPSQSKFTKRCFMNLLDTESKISSGLLPTSVPHVQRRFRPQSPRRKKAAIAKKPSYNCWPHIQVPRML